MIFLIRGSDQGYSSGNNEKQFNSVCIFLNKVFIIF